jgi:hypothetical protein
VVVSNLEPTPVHRFIQHLTCKEGNSKIALYSHLATRDEAPHNGRFCGNFVQTARRGNRLAGIFLLHHNRNELPLRLGRGAASILASELASGNGLTNNPSTLGEHFILQHVAGFSGAFPASVLCTQAYARSFA